MAKSNLILISLVIMSLLMASCKQSESSSGTVLTTKVAEWARETNFKVDFVNDKGANIQNLKGSKELVDYILDGVESGELTAYNYDDIEASLSPNDVKQLFHPIDTIITYDSETGFESGEKAVQNELNRPAIQKFRAKQRWYYDSDQKQLQSELIALAPLESISNPDGSHRGDLPLFWVRFDQ